MSNPNYKLLHNLGIETVSNQGSSVGVKNITGAAYLNVTVVNGTTPTLDVDIEEEDPSTGIWYIIASFAQKVATGKERVLLPAFIGSSIRAAWVIGGSSPGPDFTFSVSIATKD